MSGYIREALQAIYEKHGRLDATLTVDEARADDHPLHHRFEWDDALAGEKYRLVQAGDLIRKVTIVRVDEDRKESTRIRAFLHIPSAGEDEDSPLATYMPTEVVSASAELTEIARREMQRRLKELRRTYGEYEEFWKEIRALVAA